MALVDLLTTVFLLGVMMAGLKVLGTAVYRLWFHPLRHYPGPLLAKLTDGYAAYHSWKGDLHLDMWRLHETYGEYVRHGPNRLLFNTTTALEKIYASGANVRKCKGYSAMMARTPNTITQRDKTKHARQRRLLGHGLSEAALKSYTHIIARLTRKFCTHLDAQDELNSQNGLDMQDKDPAYSNMDDRWSIPMNMAEHCDHLLFDIMLEIVYNASCNMIGSTDHHPLFSDIKVSNIRVGVLIPLQEWKNTWLDWWVFKSAIVARYRFIDFIKKLMQQKTQDCGVHDQRCIYDILMSSREGGMAPVEVASESTNLILAGYDTSSTALAACLFYLSRSPTAYAKVAAEVRSQVAHLDAVADATILYNCSFLRACVDESLRLAPPVPAAPFREVEAGGITVDGHILPAGCDVGTGIYALHHNSAYFPEPFAFRPERWLEEQQQDTKSMAHRAFHPFSRGPRHCIGRSLALLELHSALAALLLCFDFRPFCGPGGHLGEGRRGDEWGRHRMQEFQLYDHVMASKQGPILQFRRRQGW